MARLAWKIELTLSTQGAKVTHKQKKKLDIEHFCSLKDVWKGNNCND